MTYLHWNQETVTDFSEKNISEMYDRGYVFTRIGRGVMHQTRSVRIDLSKFELSSENRRILKKVESVSMQTISIPLTTYDFKIGKLAKDFYDTKFGPGIMSAAKIKEVLTDVTKSNFNEIFEYSTGSPVGYTICYRNANMVHYSYPFYDLNTSPKDMGLGMMIKAIDWAKAHGLTYVYLGSLQRPTDTYKLQFKGLEWFDGTVWSQDEEKVRNILKSATEASE
jgi:arginyl-tRNA--protein-N-Asp/Glu arginylyltransferase